VTLLAATCALAAVLLARPHRARLRLAAPGGGRRGADLAARHRLTGRRAGLCLVAGAVLLFVAFGPATLVVVCLVVTVALGLRAVRGRGAAGSCDADVDLALAIDLMAAAMACGAMPAVALAAVAPGVPGPAGDALAQAATALGLGVDPDTVWSAVADVVPPLHPAARVCARSAWSGAAVSEELFRLAAAARADGQVRRRRRLQRAGVWLVLPLGLCFLPAFVLVGVVPVVVAAVPGTAR